MDARHCAGAEMADIMAYAASVGSARAQREVGAKGFIGNANDATAHYFGQERGLGTMPHALIGYAGSTLRAARDVPRDLPRRQPLTVLVDYFGREVTDSLDVCAPLPDLAHAGPARRPPRHAMAAASSRGWTPRHPTPCSNATCRDAIRSYRNETELR